MTDELVVSEIFGPTFQGEGPSAGRRAMFLRLGRCDLTCGWCDTPYTWDWERFDPEVELHRRRVDEVRSALEDIDAPLLVVTGGEPLLQQRRLVPLLQPARWRVEIETNGRHAPIPDLVDAVDQWNVSPKLANSGVAANKRRVPQALKALAATGRAIAKFVVADAGDLDEAADIVNEAGFTEVWVMPEAADAATLLQRGPALAEAAMDRGWNFSTRLHVLLWGDRRGV